jgi:hypothetical protein
VSSLLPQRSFVLAGRVAWWLAPLCAHCLTTFGVLSPIETL